MTLHRTLAPALFALALGLVALPAHADQADELFVEGQKAFEANDLPVARDRFLAAYRLRPSFDIAANLSVVESKLGMLPEAAEHLEFALGVFPPSGDPKAKTQMEADLAALKAKLGRVRLDAPPACSLKLNGKEQGSVPEQGTRTIWVTPGSHTIEGFKTGVGSGSLTLQISPGQEMTLTLILKPGPGDVGPGPGPVEPASEPFPLWPGLVVGGVGVASLGAGLGLALAAGGAGSNADELAAGLAPGACQSASPPADCATIQSDLESRDTLSNASLGLFVAGGALTAAGVVLVVVSATSGGSASDDAPAKPAVGFVPWLAPGLAGGSLVGSF